MAAREHPPHFKPTTTPKTAIREAAQTPAILWALRSTLPTTNNRTFSWGGVNPNTGTPKVAREKEKTLQLDRASEEICGGSSDDGQLS